MCVRFLTVLLIVVALTQAIAGCSKVTKSEYLLGTSRSDTAASSLGNALQTVVNSAGDVQISAIETKGSVENIERLRSGSLDFGLVQGGVVFDDTGLRSVASVDIEYLHIIVPQQSKLQAFRDLAGARIATGERGFGSYALVQSILQSASLEPSVELVQTRNLEQALAEPDIDAAMFVASLRREMTPLLKNGKYRLIPITRAHALAVDLFDVRIAVIPAGAYGQNLSLPPQPLQTLAVDTNLFVREDTPNHVVRRLTEALFTYYVRSVAHLPGLNEVTAREQADLKLHPAAERYYERNAPVRADQFEIAAFGLAALLTLLSTMRWLVMWIRERRIRVNPRAVSDLLQGIAASAVSEPATNTNIAELLREAQQRWMDGKIDDEELRMIYDAASAYTGYRYQQPHQNNVNNVSK